MTFAGDLTDAAVQEQIDARVVELPYGTPGKVLRRELREQAAPEGDR